MSILHQRVLPKNKKMKNCTLCSLPLHPHHSCSERTPSFINPPAAHDFKISTLPRNSWKYITHDPLWEPPIETINNYPALVKTLKSWQPHSRRPPKNDCLCNDGSCSKPKPKEPEKIYDPTSMIGTLAQKKE